MLDIKDKNTYLIGMMGCSKSTIAPILASRLGYSFIDTDRKIEALNNLTTREIFKTMGEPKFRELETEALKGVATNTQQIVATGGDIAIEPRNWSYLHQGLSRARIQRILAAALADKQQVTEQDIDRWIVEDYLNQLGTDRKTIGKVGWQNLLEIAERLKIRLNDRDKAQESWLDEDIFMSYDLTLDRSQLAELLEAHQLLEQFRNAVDEILALGLRKGVQKSDIDPY